MSHGSKSGLCSFLQDKIRLYCIKTQLKIYNIFPRLLIRGHCQERGGTLPVPKHIHRQIVIAFSLILAVCIALTVSFYIFSRNGAQVQHEEAAHSLEATAETARNIVNSHIQGNLQTLVTLSAFIGYDSDEGLPPQQLLHDPAFLAQLDVVNSQNEFLRMGVVDTTGQGSFVLLDGSSQLEQDLSQDSAVQRALAGEGNISFTFWDDTLGCYVNRYAVPIYQGGVDGPVIGVLTGTNNTDALRELLSPSLLLNGQVHAHIVNSEGKFVVRNQTYFISEDARSIFDTPAFSDELQQTILSAFAVNESAFFSLTNEGTLYEVALIPMDVNDWYVMCVVPQRILVTNLSQWFNLQRITFFVIFLLVILLTLYIYRMMRQNNRSMNQLTYFDSITGAYNRVRFLQEMPTKLTADPKALVVLDIDNAPTIKDLYGLERFNSLLRHIKEALDQQMGPTELFCMGRNERFFLLLDCAEPEQVRQRMSRFLELGDGNGVAVTLNHASHLVVGDGKELVVRYRSLLGLELIKAQRNISVFQFLCSDGIRRVVNQHVRVAAHIYQVYHFVVHRSRIIGHTVQE